VRRSALFVAFSTVFWAAPGLPSDRAPDPPSARPPDRLSDLPPDRPAVHAEMRNVHFQIAPGVWLDIARLTGRLIPRDSTRAPVLDDKHSFSLEIATAEISIDTASLGNLLSNHVFAYPGSPLRSLRVETDGNELVQRGVLHGLLPFTLHAGVTLTPEGLIRLRPRKVEVFGLGVRGLMRFFGLNLEKLATIEPGHGVRIDGDDFLLDPTAIRPPPRTRGRMTALRVGNGVVHQTFGGPAPPARAPVGSEPANYMFYAGASLTFGKLTMKDTDLLILDDDASDPFDFFLDRYHDQLVAGYSRNTPDRGLVVRMPDLSDMKRPMRLKPLPRD
jgi:hypothetical protein